MKHEITVLPIDEIIKILENKKPLGLFLGREKKQGRNKGLFIAIRNLSGQAVFEKFSELEDAKEWLEIEK